MRKTQFANGNYYHIFNRGVDKRNIFMDKRDYFRFLGDLYKFNDTAPATDPRLHRDPVSVFPRECLVGIAAFCLMPNHFHILIRQERNMGISEFMQKLGTGYTRYFNDRHRRSGRLFQGPFKAVLVTNEPQLLHLSRYIHLNPVDIMESGWKENGIIDWHSTNTFLKKYRWSSYLDWIGIKNFPSILDTSLRDNFTFASTDHENFVGSWAIKDISIIKKYTFE